MARAPPSTLLDAQDRQRSEPAAEAFLARISHNQVENDVFHGMRGVQDMEFRVASLKRLRRAGRRIADHPGAGRPARSAASVMNPVEPGFYVGARLAQINRKSFQYGKAGPNAR